MQRSGLHLEIFLIPRLLADQHESRGAWTGAKHDMGGRPVQLAASALARSRAQRAEARRVRDKWPAVRVLPRPTSS